MRHARRHANCDAAALLRRGASGRVAVCGGGGGSLALVGCAAHTDTRLVATGANAEREPGTVHRAHRKLRRGQAQARGGPPDGRVRVSRSTQVRRYDTIPYSLWNSKPNPIPGITGYALTPGQFLYTSTLADLVRFFGFVASRLLRGRNIGRAAAVFSGIQSHVYPQHRFNRLATS
jgi:hypothetical protein